MIAGLTLTVTTTRELVDLVEAKALLSRTVLRRVERRAIDKRAWDRERKAGTISDEIANKCVTVEDITPRLYLSQPKEQAAA